MTTQEVVSEEIAEELLAMTDDQLGQLLRARVKAFQKDPGLSLQSSFDLEPTDLEAVEVPRWLEKTADAIVNAALRQTHNVICSDDADFKELRDQLVAALGLGGTAAVLAFTAFLTTVVGLAAALASVVATIAIKKIGLPALEAGHKTMCQELAQHLPQ